MATVKEWGKLKNGGTAELYTLFGRDGVCFTISNFGGIVTSVQAPDKNGDTADIVLGYDTLDEYVADDAYIGATVGRFANRIKDARFTLGGKEYPLTRNENENQLHGGGGFHKKLWKLADLAENSLEFSLHSPDGEDGFPGALDVRMRAGIEGHRITLRFHAVSDRDTYLSMTNHAYFNLRGYGDILSHIARINARYYTPVGPDLIPTGALVPVTGTELDYNTPRRIENPALDHNFVLSDSVNAAAEIWEPESGRHLSLWTDLPGLQFYSGGNMTRRTGKVGSDYERNSGFCLEPQFFPNSPNEPHFPSCLLKAGETYDKFISFKLSVK